jgi:hypothetical protein
MTQLELLTADKVVRKNSISRCAKKLVPDVTRNPASWRARASSPNLPSA